MLCQRLHGGFGGVVGRVARRIRDALFAACYHNRGGLVLGTDDWNEGVEAIDYAEEVYGHDLMTNGQVSVDTGKRSEQVQYLPSESIRYRPSLH